MPSRVNSRAVFTDAILPDGPSRARFIGASFGLQSMILTVLVVIPILMPHRMQVAARNLITPIAAPLVSEWKPQPPAPKPEVKKVVVKELPKPVEQAVVPVPKPKIYNPVFSSAVAPKAAVEKKVQAPVVDVAKDLPSLGSSAIPDLKKPREAVQTGGFGDPNSVPDNHNVNRAPNMSAMGGFDMPNGPGQGNGTGGVKGAKGVVASTGFGDGVATGVASSGAHGSVQQGLFGDERAAGPEVKHTAMVERYKPMELVYVPKTTYTDEARAKKVEGEVVLQVVFTASGEVKVLRVVQGLGYGLDEAAESAARQIQFHPAQQDGQPVDTTANVRMKCKLAY